MFRKLRFLGLKYFKTFLNLLLILWKKIKAEIWIKYLRNFFLKTLYLILIIVDVWCDSLHGCCTLKHWSPTGCKKRKMKVIKIVVFIFGE